MGTVSDAPERWTKASIYPDMWADPGEDPRSSAGVSPDGELATLQEYLRNYRLTVLGIHQAGDALHVRGDVDLHPRNPTRAR